MKSEEPTPSPSTPFGWAEFHNRVETTQQTLDRHRVRSPEETHALLRARAKALAQTPETRQVSVITDVVIFRLAHEQYAIESHYVREILPYREVTPVPCTPAFVLGVMNVRGEIISVIDLKNFFALPVLSLLGLSKFILLRRQKMAVAVAADAVLDARQIPLQALQPTLPTLTGIRAEFLKGISADGLIVLDGGKLLASRAIVVQEDVGR